MEAWNQIVSAAGDVYHDELAFGAHAVGFSRHWKEEYSLLARDFENLLSERQKAVDAAKADTYAGWTQARNSLAGIVHASGTPENKAALARAPLSACTHSPRRLGLVTLTIALIMSA